MRHDRRGLDQGRLCWSSESCDSLGRQRLSVSYGVIVFSRGFHTDTWRTRWERKSRLESRYRRASLPTFARPSCI